MIHTRKKYNVLIAHCLSAIHHADQIVVLNKDFVAEAGTHEELMEKNQIYTSLVASQIYVQPKNENSHENTPRYPD